MVPIINIIDLFIVLSLTIAACLDIATRTIPNGIPVIVAVAGLIVHVLAHPETLAGSAAASAVLFAVLALLHMRGLLGGGDVKLMAAIALGFSVTGINRFVFTTVIAGGVLALVHLAARWALRGRPLPAPPRRGASVFRRVLSAERWRIARHGSLPYGVAIAIGGIWVILSTGGN